MKKLLGFFATLMAAVFFCGFSLAQAPLLVQSQALAQRARSIPQLLKTLPRTSPGAVAMHRGKVVGGATASATNGVPFYFWSSCKICAPGTRVQIMGQALQDFGQADGLSIQVYEQDYFIDGSGNLIFSWGRPLSVHGASGMGQGYFPFFGQFATSILAEDEIGGSAFERRDFIVYAYRAGTSSPIQSTLITIYTLAGPAQGEMAPIVINDVIPISNGNTVTPLLTGTFPVNQSMFYWVGVPGSDGAFETVASCVSTDGFFAACASIGQDIPYRFAGDVVLMTSDGSYSTRSPVGFRF